MNDDGWQSLREDDQISKPLLSPMTPERRKKVIIIVVSIIIGVLIVAALAVFLYFYLRKDEKVITIKDLNITLIADVYPDGQRISAISVELILENVKEAIEIDNSKLTNDTFYVNDRNVTNVHSCVSLEDPHKISNGKYIIIELDPKDENASSIINDFKNHYQGRKNVTLQIQQKQSIYLTNGESLSPTTATYENDPQENKDINLIVDDFTQEKFKLTDDQSVDYNLYVPKSVKTAKKDDTKYPLILFMHDGSIQCNDTRMTLFQGVGGTIWASKEEQQIRESFVVAPCFTTVIVNDDWKTSGQYPLIIPMLQNIISKYENYINTNRIYTTGQSMGAMTSISLMCDYRDFFASAMIVAGQWNETLMLNMVNDTFWIL